MEGGRCDEWEKRKGRSGSSLAAAYSLHPVKTAILTFEKNLTKNAILENRSIYLPN
jgi:hypothetical protein